VVRQFGQSGANFLQRQAPINNVRAQCVQLLLKRIDYCVVKFEIIDQSVSGSAPLPQLGGEIAARLDQMATTQP